MAACQPIVALASSCGNGAKTPGLEKIWMISYNDISKISATVSEVYTLSNSGLVNAIGITAGSTNKFVSIGTLKNSAGLNAKYTGIPEKGIGYFTQTFNLTLSDITLENQQWVYSVINQPVAVLVYSRTKKYYIAGLSGNLQCTTSEGGLGQKEDDDFGFKLTFEGIDSLAIPLIADNLISTIIA